MTYFNNLTLCVCYVLVLFQQSSERNIEEKCTTCRELVEKFREGMEKTAKNHFGGGDTAWEESRLGSYARSETRLLEILETVCKHSTKGTACHAMVEEYEEEIEHFWFKKQNELSDFEKFLCINVAKVCCASGQFSKTCEDCPGGNTNPCFGRGKCDGNGTRGGTGKCNCDSKYSGELCDECSDGHYDAHGNLTCDECHETCELTCTDGTNKGCDTCKDGYDENPEEGCIDIDECEDESKCEEENFCINKKGSYTCNKCDPACSGGCTGTGHLSCKECNTGWKKIVDAAGCEDINECEAEHNCAIGTYCVNTDGTYNCENCNVACSGGCKNDEPNTCAECATGYKATEEGCVDIDECTDKNITCLLGQTCVNKPGPDSCEPCHENCIGCVTPEATGCVVCKKGYHLAEKGCEDTDECKSNPCKFKGEKCHNLLGSYNCKCKKGWVRTKKKDCKKKAESKKKKEEEVEDIEDDARDEL